MPPVRPRQDTYKRRWLLTRGCIYRLKLKCDGKVPCNQCSKRGCTAICPDGTQTTGHGHRLFWKTTSELRIKLSEYTDRIRALEAALKTAHGLVDTVPHPLLSEDQLRIADYGARNSRSAQDSAAEESSGESGMLIGDEESQANVEGITDHFGSLAISRSGDSQFFGRAAYSLVRTLAHSFLKRRLINLRLCSASCKSVHPSSALVNICLSHHAQNEESSEADSVSSKLSDEADPPFEDLAQMGSFPFALVLPPHTQPPKPDLRMLHGLLPTEHEALHLQDCAFRFAFFMCVGRPLVHVGRESDASQVASYPARPLYEEYSLFRVW
jgi:hypothetical protein